MIIKNVKVYSENKKFFNGTIRIHDNKIQDVYLEEISPKFVEASKDEYILDGKGCYAIPGMIDIHFHGCNGHDFCDGTHTAIEEIAKYQASIGVTSISPATMTLAVSELTHILTNAAIFRKQQQQKAPSFEADLVGVNMEGPFISEEKKGAQNKKYIIPCEVSVFQEFQNAAGGLVKFIGVAPERGNAIEFINKVKDQVTISLAHTNADYDTAKAAFDAGASHAVHLYNAMPAFTHRKPGVIGAVADCKHVTAELICDGVHIHPAVVRATFQMLGEDRIIFISDCIRATGLKDGYYTLGGLDVQVNGNHATLVEDGALAGSVTTLPDCVRVAVKQMGIPLETAIACSTMNPAKRLGIYDHYGSITTGKIADIVLLDKDLKLKAVIKNGVILN